MSSASWLLRLKKALRNANAPNEENPYATMADIVGSADFSAVAEDILPDADDTYDLGSAVKRWAEAYINKVLFYDTLEENSIFINRAAGGGLQVVHPDPASEASNLFAIKADGGAQAVFEIATDGDADFNLRESAIFSFLDANTNPVLRVAQDNFAIFAPAATPTTVLSIVGMDGAAPYIATSHHMEFTEKADPAAPAANKARLYAKDNGSGKTQLVVLFPTGAVQVLATEP